MYICGVKIHEKYIKRCLELAKNGIGSTSPNPSVGAVVVVDDVIIGEGYTSAYGGSHAEVNAINSVKDKMQLKDATIYVSLEPCNHHGKTPPCSDLIIRSGIKNVVIGCIDPFEKVAGGGIKKLKDNGCNVTLGVLEEECLESNKRFFTFLRERRPYIVLKWAETNDGFIDIDRKVGSIDEAKPNWITNIYSRQLVHKWRAEEDAILVGTNTVLKDNPKLDVRDFAGKNPVRVVLDRTLRIPKNCHIYNGKVKTIILTEVEKKNTENVIFESIDFSKNVAQQICEVLCTHKILSVIVEGGKQTLETFIKDNLWHEARVFKGKISFLEGIKAPNIKGELISETNIKEDTLKIIQNERHSNMSP